jgi:formylglycine-generating enzyme required for sulfatase activity
MHLNFLRFLLVGAWLVLGVSPDFAQQNIASGGTPARFALIIGNSDYPDANPPLNLPVKSARAFAAELRRSDFDVDLKENLGKEEMRRAIDAFVAKIKPGSAALLFFSGYGIQAGRQSFMVPTNAQIWTEADVRQEAISVESVLNLMDDRGAKPKLVVLDASRRNPFERRFRSLSAGLAAIDLPPGSLVISAAAQGKVISDAEGDTSLFLGELLKEMRSPGPSAEEVFNRTRLGVTRASNGEQAPWGAASLREAFYFGPAASTSLLGPNADSSGKKAPLARVAPPAGDLKPGLVFRDCDDCPDLVIVPNSEFDMGSNDFEFEQPIHKVTIGRAFAIGRTEVTFAQWDACVAAAGCNYRPDDRGRGRGDLPVTDVSWNDAKSYLAWLSRRTGRNYRLPSEAEWEYAARGGTNSVFWWGAELQPGYANCRNCGGENGKQTSPVGSFQANRFGLVDTAGNVAEWVEDCWNDSYRGAPTDGSARTLGQATIGQSAAGQSTSGQCKQRGVRGGSFDTGARFIRSASRFLYDADIRYYAIGFRILRDLP